MEETEKDVQTADADEERSLLSAYKVRSEAYEGPFDLMLALIDRGELDLYSISLTDITRGFIDYIRTAQVKQMQIGGEFLLMAAYLLEMKSRKLLPQAAEAEEEEALVEVEEELLRRLAEYKVYKNLAQSLKERKEVFQRVYTRYSPEEAKADQEIFLVDVSLKDLVLAFKRVWETAQKEDETKEIIAESFSVNDKIAEIRGKLAANPSGISFNSLFTTFRKTEIIITFLAILELIKQKSIRIMQNESFGDILIFGALEA